MKKLAIVSIFTLFTLHLSAQDITKGTWFNAEKTAKVQFYTSGEKLFGKIIWLEEPNKDGKPRTDNFNPDAKLKSKPLMGLIFLKNFKKISNTKWEDGTIYDPKTGKTYSSEMTLENQSKLNVRGYIGISLIGKTSVFTRASNE